MTNNSSNTSSNNNNSSDTTTIESNNSSSGSKTILHIFCDWLLCLWNLIQLIFSVGRLASGLGSAGVDERNESLVMTNSILQHLLAQEESEDQLYNHSHLELLHDDRNLSRSISIKISNINRKLSKKESAFKRAHRRHTIVGVCVESPCDEITTRNSMDESAAKELTSYGCTAKCHTFHTSASKDDIHTLMNHYLDPTLCRKAISFPTSPAEMKSSPRVKRTTIFWKLDRSELVFNSESSSMNNTPKHSNNRQTQSFQQLGGHNNCSSWNAIETAASPRNQQATITFESPKYEDISMKYNSWTSGDIPKTKELTNMAMGKVYGELKNNEEPNIETLATKCELNADERPQRKNSKLKTRRYQNETNCLQDEILNFDRNVPSNTEAIPMHSQHHHNYLQNFTMEEVIYLKERLENYKFP